MFDSPAPSSRRGFLRALITLPLIGSITLIGAPSAAARAALVLSAVGAEWRR